MLVSACICCLPALPAPWAQSGSTGGGRSRGPGHTLQAEASPAAPAQSPEHRLSSHGAEQRSFRKQELMLPPRRVLAVNRSLGEDTTTTTT